jgi:hypothetical protein
MTVEQTTHELRVCLIRQQLADLVRGAREWRDSVNSCSPTHQSSHNRILVGSLTPMPMPIAAVDGAHTDKARANRYFLISQEPFI